MPTSFIPSLLIYIFAVGYTPGPANLYALSCSIRYGKRKALVMWLGMLVGFTIAVSVLAVVTHIIGEALGQYVAYIKYLGAAYIIYLAWKIYHMSGCADARQGGCSFLTGMVVQLTNAKMMVFDIAMFGMFVLPYSHRLSDLFIVAAWLLIAGPLGNLVWLLVGSWLRHYIAGYEHKVDTAMAICLVICAGMVLFS